MNEKQEVHLINPRVYFQKAEALFGSLESKKDLPFPRQPCIVGPFVLTHASFFGCF
jgi:hypothetical protein